MVLILGRISLLIIAVLGVHKALSLQYLYPASATQRYGLQSSHVTTESAASLDILLDQRTHFRALVAEAEALFGGPRYDHYDLLLSLGDAIDHYTLEHFESSENRLPDHGLSDPRILRTTASMIPHEYAHSWNGKYRTPEGLNIRTYPGPDEGISRLGLRRPHRLADFCCYG